MRKQDFENFLCKEPSITSTKAVSTRVKHAKKVEAILGVSLDVTVSNDDSMYEALDQLQQSDSKAHAPMQNALRKYYKFCNGKEFPRMKNYHSPKHP